MFAPSLLVIVFLAALESDYYPLTLTKKDRRYTPSLLRSARACPTIACPGCEVQVFIVWAWPSTKPAPVNPAVTCNGFTIQNSQCIARHNIYIHLFIQEPAAIEESLHRMLSCGELSLRTAHGGDVPFIQDTASLTMIQRTSAKYSLR